MKNIFLALCLISLFASNAAQANTFALPLDCDMENNCYVRYYPDRSSSPTMPTTAPAQDYNCGNMAKKNYWATDFQATTYIYQNAPAVLASAPGKVISVRRTMPDNMTTRFTPYQTPLGMEAGNSIVIRHNDGHTTQYSHLKFASILVTEGQRVAQGDKIAEMGSSGATEAPKLSFSVRKNGHPVDPFNNNEPDGWNLCGIQTSYLWDEAAYINLNYRDLGLSRVGFSETIPESHRLRSGQNIPAIRRSAPESIVFWADLYGIKENDIIYMRILDPLGNVFSENEHIARTDYPLWLAYTGRHIHTRNLTSGLYVGEVVIQRDGNIVISQVYNQEIMGSRHAPTKPKVQ